MRHQMGILVSQNVILSNFAQEKLDQISQAGAERLALSKTNMEPEQPYALPSKNQPVHFILGDMYIIDFKQHLIHS